MGKILPILLALLGTGAGVGAGLFLAPPEPPAEEHAAEDCLPPKEEVKPEIPVAESPPIQDREFVKFNNQFIVPLVENDRVAALVVAGLSVEVGVGGSEIVYSREPKLRDAFLRVFLMHANMGGFEGNFTDLEKMDLLRRTLLDAAYPILGDSVTDILITEIAKQET